MHGNLRSGTPARASGAMEPPEAGVLLVNLGTPEAPRTPEVRAYLAEFLSDPRVVDLPAPARWLLLRLVILPFRSPRSAEAYASIWTPDGSPLLVHSRALEAALGRELEEAVVVLAMRYGRPSVRAGLERLRDAGCGRLVVFPLYPQFATSSTLSSLECVERELAALRWSPQRASVPAFYDDEAFLEAFCERGRPLLARERPDAVVFSFHGLPERHVRAVDPTRRHCLERPDCCDTTAVAPDCYRAQSCATARGIAGRLELGDGTWHVAFQSRLGRAAWIPPATEDVLDRLAAEGVRRVAVFCPSFVADCLETLEEVALRYRERFLGAGGESLALVPSLNAERTWVRAAARLARAALAEVPA